MKRAGSLWEWADVGAWRWGCCWVGWKGSRCVGQAAGSWWGFGHFPEAGIGLGGIVRGAGGRDGWGAVSVLGLGLGALCSLAGGGGPGALGCGGAYGFGTEAPRAAGSCCMVWTAIHIINRSRADCPLFGRQRPGGGVQGRVGLGGCWQNGVASAWGREPVRGLG